MIPMMYHTYRSPNKALKKFLVVLFGVVVWKQRKRVERELKNFIREG